jgi:SPP1 family holin
MEDSHMNAAIERRATTDTWVRTVVFGITLINQILISFNRNPLPWSDSEMYELVSLFASVVTTLWVYWKNNSWTHPAIVADEKMHEMKAKAELREVKK